MVKVRWCATVSTRSDVQVASRLRKIGLARRERLAMQIIRMLESFLTANPGMRMRDPEEGWDAFIGQLANETRAGKTVRTSSTILRYAEVARRYGIRPGRIEEARCKVEAAALDGGLSATAREEARPVRFRILSCQIYMWPIADRAGDRVYRAGLLILLMTGCRAEHLNRVREIALAEEGVWILWGDRKVRERRNSRLLYQFKWSCRPPPALRAILISWPTSGSALLNSQSGGYCVANRLNTFMEQRLGAKAEGMSTSFFRRRMTTLLLGEIEAGRMSRLMYENLMDHTEGTADGKYRLEGDPSELKLPAAILEEN